MNCALQSVNCLLCTARESWGCLGGLLWLCAVPLRDIEKLASKSISSTHWGLRGIRSTGRGTLLKKQVGGQAELTCCQWMGYSGVQFACAFVISMTWWMIFCCVASAVCISEIRTAKCSLRSPQRDALGFLPATC